MQQLCTQHHCPCTAAPAVIVCVHRPKGSFMRGSCESFSLSSAAGDIGRIEAVKVWHEPGGAAIGGSWCLQQVDVEAVFRGGFLVTHVWGGVWMLVGAAWGVFVLEQAADCLHEQLV